MNKKKRSLLEFWKRFVAGGVVLKENVVSVPGLRLAREAVPRSADVKITQAVCWGGIISTWLFKSDWTLHARSSSDPSKGWHGTLWGALKGFKACALECSPFLFPSWWVSKMALGKKNKNKNLPFGNCTKSWIENSILDVIGAFLDWQRPREFIFILGKKKKKRHEFSANRCVIEPAPGTQHTGELNSSCWQPNVSFLSGHKRRRMNPRLKSFPSYGIVPLCKAAEIVRQAD